MKVFPTPYWIPKMDKSPTGTRFIIASEQCLIKSLSQSITVFKSLHKSVEKYHNKSKFCFRDNSFWVIQNIKQVIEKQLNRSQHTTFQYYMPTYQMTNLLKH